jgi:tRNA(fMet)-specific endonuclease VapC
LLTHLIDTDICIYVMKARDLGLARKLEGLAGKCAISDLSILELYAGAQRYEHPNKRLNLIEDFVSRLTVLPFDTQAARLAGPIRYKLLSEGQMIGAYDLLIAATALSKNLAVVTNNLREFRRVDGLVVETWD